MERRFITKDEFTKFKFDVAQDEERSKVQADVTKQMRSIASKMSDLETAVGNTDTEFGSIRQELR